MRIRNSALTVLLVAMLASAPVAVAGWAALGNYEPDMKRDVTDGWAHLNPDTNASGRMVYFNGLFSVTNSQGAGISPNSGVLRTSIGVNEYAVYVLMGVWKDCNKDGYVGLADQGLWEYRRELLNTTGVCTTNTPPAAPYPDDWVTPHNDGQWVHEFITIGWRAATNDTNLFDMNDNGSRAWYDYGQPDPGAGGNSCWLNPPRGSMQTTGGMLWWSDCILGYHVTDGINTITALDPALAPLSFADHPRDQYNSDSDLNQRNPWGVEHDGSNAQVWDCSQPKLVNQKIERTQVPGVVTVNEAWVNLSTPSTNPSVGTSGTPAGTANATGAGLDRCDRRTDLNGGGRGGQVANAPYSAEADVRQSADKQDSDGVLSGAQLTGRPTYKPVANQKVGDTEIVTPDAGWAVGNVTGTGTPRNGGLHVASFDGLWRDNSLWTSTFPVRTSDFKPSDPAHVTFYGFVSGAAVAKYDLTLPKASNGAYGSESCGTSTTGIHNGWDCNKANWWKNALGEDASVRSPYLGKDHSLASNPPCTTTTNTATDGNSRGCINISPYPGSPFNLRDVDCIDQSSHELRKQGVSWATVSGGVRETLDPTDKVAACAAP